MTADNEDASDRALDDYEDDDYEDVAAELEHIAEKVRNAPELDHDAAERLLKLAKDIRADLDRLGRVSIDFGIG
jgi:hypothetical protein